MKAKIMTHKITQALPDQHRLFVLEIQESIHGYLKAATETRVKRQILNTSIRDRAEHGMVALCWQSRDCDMCVATYRTLVNATITAYNDECEQILYGAEGPTSFWLQKPSDPFRSEFRDLVMEAHEDGHPYTIYA